MTPEEIKKIAEEVAHLRAFDGGYFPHEKEIREDYEVLLQWLTERYYLVEKGKVEEEYEAAKWHKETAEGMNIQYGKGMAKGQLITLENLFGPDIRKEEEE